MFADWLIAANYKIPDACRMHTVHRISAIAKMRTAPVHAIHWASKARSSLKRVHAAAELRLA